MMPSVSPANTSLQSSQSQILSQVEHNPRTRRHYRPARSLPYELRQHCIIYFEEGLYIHALALLTNLLVSGSSSASPSPNSPAYAPSPSILALLSTLVVHPSLTTRSNSEEKLGAANQAFYFLAHANALLGPINARFRQAFQSLEKSRTSAFRKSNVASFKDTRTPAKRENGLSALSNFHSAQPQGEDLDDDDFIKTYLATDGSLWACAVDFWHIVGWSFNCAVRYTQRWERWKLLLQLLLQIMEDDWAERLAAFYDLRNDVQYVSDPSMILRESLVMQMLAGCTGAEGGAGRRRMFRAIFANGSSAEIAEFHEVFPRETAARKLQDDLGFTANRQVNIDEGQYGDYFENEDEDEGASPSDNGARNEMTIPDDSQSTKILHSSNVKRAIENATSINSYGGYEALQIRRRLLILLTNVSNALPAFFTNLSTFIDVVEEFLRPLPLSVYVALLYPTISAPSDAKIEVDATFSPNSHISLLQELARSLLPQGVSRNRDNYLTQQVLEEFYLPFSAKSARAVDNAKLSFVLEAMIRLLKKHVGLSGAQGRFRGVVEKGIRARRTRVQSKEERSAEEAEAWSSLISSEMRLEVLVRMIEDDT